MLPADNKEIEKDGKRDVAVGKLVGILHSLRQSIDTLQACESVASNLCSKACVVDTPLEDIVHKFDKLKFSVEAEERVIKFFTINGFSVKAAGEEIEIKFLTE